MDLSSEELQQIFAARGTVELEPTTVEPEEEDTEEVSATDIAEAIPSFNLAPEVIAQVEALLPSPAELQIFLSYLDLRSSTLEQLIDNSQEGLATLFLTTEDLLPRLDEITPNVKAARRSDQEILELRKQAYDKINRLFIDPVFLNSALEVVGSYENEYGRILYELFDALLDLSDDEWVSLRDFIAARVTSVVNFASGGFKQGMQPAGASVIVEVSGERHRLRPDDAGRLEEETVFTPTGLAGIVGEDEPEATVRSARPASAPSTAAHRPAAQPQPPAPRPPKPPAPESAPATEAEAIPKSWAETFAEDVKAILKTLDTQNLLQERPIRADKVSLLAVSTKMGTIESLNRLRSAGVIGRDQAHQKGMLNAHEIVAMVLFNNHQDAFRSNARRRRQAMAIIKDSITTYRAESRHPSRFPDPSTR